MIKIEAKRVDGNVELKVRIEGPADDVIPEAECVLLHFPAEMAKANKAELAKIIDDVTEEIEGALDLAESEAAVCS